MPKAFATAWISAYLDDRHPPHFDVSAPNYKSLKEMDERLGASTLQLPHWPTFVTLRFTSCGSLAISHCRCIIRLGHGIAKWENEESESHFWPPLSNQQGSHGSCRVKKATELAEEVGSYRVECGHQRVRGHNYDLSCLLWKSTMPRLRSVGL